MVFHAKDPRKNRFSQVNRYYLVTTVTYKRMCLFEEFDYARIVIQSLRLVDAKGYSTTIGFVLMPDHLHWLVQLSSKITLGKTVGYVKGLSARRINQLRAMSESVWQHGFHDHAI